MNAVILCAGKGERFQPLSLVRPKPLTPVNNISLLEQSVALLRRHGVQRIVVITGYMAEAFAEPARRLGLELRYNARYADTNNSTSLALAHDLLALSVPADRNNDNAACLVLDGDLFFCNNFFPLLRSGVSQFVSQRTVRGLEWEMRLDDVGRVLSVDKWSPQGWGMVGVSCWSGEGARQLAQELTRCAPDEYWEDAALRVLTRTPVYAVCAEQNFVLEVDTVRDALDTGLLTHEEIARLTSVDFVPEKLKGLTNNTWLVRDAQGCLRTLRVPGKGTDRYLRREHEPLVLEHILHLDITPATTFYPGGFKTTFFLEQHRISTRRDATPAYFRRLASLLQMLHSLPHRQDSPLQPLYIAADMQLYEGQCGRRASEPQRRWLLERARAFDAEPQVLCHRDLLLENILVSGPDGQGMQLIDFEYAGFTHPLWDTASFILEAGIEGETRQAFVHACGLAQEEQGVALWHMEIVVDYVWGLWGLVNNYEEYGENRLHRADLRLRELL